MAEIKDPENTIIMETTKGKVGHPASSGSRSGTRRTREGIDARRRL
jgi:hypothetical protein